MHPNSSLQISDSSIPGPSRPQGSSRAASIAVQPGPSLQPMLRKPASHNVTSTQQQLVDKQSTHQGVYSHPAAVAYAAANPRRAIPKFGPYILLRTLGENEFCKVKLGLHSQWGEEVAVKLIRRGNLDTTGLMSKVEREIEVIRTLKHPNIARFCDIIETDRYIGIILEYASGGELFDYIVAHRYLKETEATRLFSQLILGVWYIHQKKFVHRDLKLQNVLLDRHRNIIITDFGFANRFEHSGDLMQTHCGSPCYGAPELIASEGQYVGSAVDIWSCGVILYVMLAGHLPFYDDPANPNNDNINLLYKYIVNTPLSFPDYTPPQARDLLSMMLVPDPARRADLPSVIAHPWLGSYANMFTKSVSEWEKATMDQQRMKRLAYQRQMEQRAPAGVTKASRSKTDGRPDTPSSQNGPPPSSTQEQKPTTSASQNKPFPVVPMESSITPRSRTQRRAENAGPPANSHVSDTPFKPQYAPMPKLFQAIRNILPPQGSAGDEIYSKHVPSVHPSPSSETSPPVRPSPNSRAGGAVANEAPDAKTEKSKNPGKLEYKFPIHGIDNATPEESSLSLNSIAQTRVYENLRKVLAKMICDRSDGLFDAFQRLAAEMARNDTVASLLQSHKYRLKLLEFSSTLGCHNEPSIREALERDEVAILDIFDYVIQSPREKDAVFRLRGKDAENFLTFLQSIADRPDIRTASVRHAAHRMHFRLSVANNFLPPDLFIQGVRRHEQDARFGGGFADIYHATYRGKEVALKKLRIFQTHEERNKIHRDFCREALVWKHFDHPNILPFLGVDGETFPNFLCMVSPWLRNGTILMHLKRSGRFVANIDKYLIQVALGAEYLHSQNIVHGDLRGANILIDDNWNVRLTDFGLTGFEETTTATNTSTYRGSTRWMAPELLRPEEFELDSFRRTFCTDVYAFGCVCLEIYTGCHPFADVANEMHVLLKLSRRERPKRPTGSSQMSDETWSIVESCWRHQPAERPSMADLVRSLKACNTGPS